MFQIANAIFQTMVGNQQHSDIRIVFETLIFSLIDKCWRSMGGDGFSCLKLVDVILELLVTASVSAIEARRWIDD